METQQVRVKIDVYALLTERRYISGVPIAEQVDRILRKELGIEEKGKKK